MARTLAAGEAVKELTQLRVIREATGTHGDTTTTEAVLGTGAETAIDVTASTNFTSGDTCVFDGSGGMEAIIIGTPATTMPVSPPPLVPQDTGALFYEAELVDLGKIAANSVNWTSTSALTPIFEELSRVPMLYIPGNIEFSLGVGLYGYSIENLQFVNGYLESVTGDGAAYATAFQGVMGKSGQTLQTNQILRIRFLRHDSKTMELDFTKAFVEAAVNAPINREAPSILNFTCKSSLVIARLWT